MSGNDIGWNTHTQTVGNCTHIHSIFLFVFEYTVGNGNAKMSSYMRAVLFFSLFFYFCSFIPPISTSFISIVSIRNVWWFGVCMLCALIRWNFAFLNERHEWSNMKWYNVYHQIFKNECLRIHCNCIEEIKSLKWGSTCSLVATVPHTLIYYFQFYITY